MISRIILVVLIVGGTVLWIVSERRTLPEKTVVEIATTTSVTASEQKIENENSPETFQRDAQSHGPLSDGTIIREWGTFIKARDIRINCRPEAIIIREFPTANDYVTKCDSRTEFDHPYALFTDAQLEQIADADAEAAYLLAYRLLVSRSPKESAEVNPERALSFAMNALTHTGEEQVFNLLIDGRKFRNWGVWATADGIPNQAQVAEKAEEYKWYKVGLNLGYVAEDDFKWKKLVRQLRQFKDYFDVDDIDTQAKVISDGVSKAQQMYVQAN